MAPLPVPDQTALDKEPVTLTTLASALVRAVVYVVLGLSTGEIEVPVILGALDVAIQAFVVGLPKLSEKLPWTTLRDRMTSPASIVLAAQESGAVEHPQIAPGPADESSLAESAAERFSLPRE